MQGLQGLVRTSDPVVDHLCARGQAGLGVQEGVAGGPGIHHDPGRGQERGVEPGPEDPALGVLGLVDVRQDRDAGGARSHRPPRDRHRVGKDRLGPASADDCAQARNLRSRLRRQSHQALGAQQSLTQDRERHDGHAGTGLAQHPHQGAVQGQGHEDLVAGIDEPMDGFDQLPVRAVKVGGRMGHEEPGGIGAVASRLAPAHRLTFPVRRPEGRWRVGPSSARRRARAS